jgi:hypothetical protein
MRLGLIVAFICSALNLMTALVDIFGDNRVTGAGDKEFHAGSIPDRQKSKGFWAKDCIAWFRAKDSLRASNKTIFPPMMHPESQPRPLALPFYGAGITPEHTEKLTKVKGKAEFV